VIFQLTWHKAMRDMLYLAKNCLKRMLDIQWTTSMWSMCSKVLMLRSNCISSVLSFQISLDTLLFSSVLFFRLKC
jgi:hypothetical protein